jgi:hypothetical protein
MSAMIAVDKPAKADGSLEVPGSRCKESHATHERRGNRTGSG